MTRRRGAPAAGSRCCHARARATQGVSFGGAGGATPSMYPSPSALPPSSESPPASASGAVSSPSSTRLLCGRFPDEARRRRALPGRLRGGARRFPIFPPSGEPESEARASDSSAASPAAAAWLTSVTVAGSSPPRSTASASACPQTDSSHRPWLSASPREGGLATAERSAAAAAAADTGSSATAGVTPPSAPPCPETNSSNIDSVEIPRGASAAEADAVATPCASATSTPSAADTSAGAAGASEDVASERGPAFSAESSGWATRAAEAAASGGTTTGAALRTAVSAPRS